jgi:hypothetical protein
MPARGSDNLSSVAVALSGNPLRAATATELKVIGAAVSESAVRRHITLARTRSTVNEPARGRRRPAVTGEGGELASPARPPGRAAAAPERASREGEGVRTLEAGRRPGRGRAGGHMRQQESRAREAAGRSGSRTSDSEERR